MRRKHKKRKIIKFYVKVGIAFAIILLFIITPQVSDKAKRYNIRIYNRYLDNISLLELLNIQYLDNVTKVINQNFSSIDEVDRFMVVEFIKVHNLFNVKMGLTKILNYSDIKDRKIFMKLVNETKTNYTAYTAQLEESYKKTSQRINFVVKILNLTFFISILCFIFLIYIIVREIMSRRR